MIRNSQSCLVGIKVEHHLTSRRASDNICARTWIPSESLKLQLKLLLILHRSSAGHKGIDGTKIILKELFYSRSTDMDKKRIFRECLHYIISHSGDIVLRLLAYCTQCTLARFYIRNSYTWDRALIF